MLLIIENLLSKDEVKQFRSHMEQAAWEPGVKTAGSLARSAKQNLQLDDASELATSLRNHILRKLGQHSLFISAALPGKIYPPKFNCYTNGGTYGTHIDSAIMPVPGTNLSVRGDLSATLFLSEPNEYVGGELEIDGVLGGEGIKLAAGDMVLYSSGFEHRVNPVTQGARFASFFWVESYVRDEKQRAILFDLDQTIQKLTPKLEAGDKELLKLTGLYHNLLRAWATT
ncbi:PKHD-type hydroxylase [Cellvibrio zantedeschiae]|uniref:PKHD-type hydroxylase n=1 Tax=Cellvibrio zantedeschiae TaxID=1237077 RepID=A0ABQ3B013_9GAMM|nr:Fe2+-dependent dioxygenase [Cellvibrio zantedeschiae]GGY69745.1 PKHD-type hydroxylase [Cellvibrio zantedeschiae]